jgi:hypothetical protein
MGFVYRRTDGQGETSIPPYNFVAGGIIRLKPSYKLGVFLESFEILSAVYW